MKALAISIDEDNPAYTATDATLTNGQYALGRYLCIYLREQPGAGIDPLAEEFARFALSADGQAIIASGSRGYLPLSSRERAEELGKLASASDGN